MNINSLEIGPDHHLTPEEVDFVARHPKVKIHFSKKAITEIEKSRKVVDGMIKDKKVVYGITTGFGNFKNKIISSDDVEKLQRNLIRSHSVGVGELLPPEQVRAIMLVRLNSLIQGYSGVRLEFVDLLREFINKNIIPAVPSQGSVGASGDLAPLSHIALSLMGEGEVFLSGTLMRSKDALKRAGLNAVVIGAKEGLAFNNGTSFMGGISALAIVRAKKIAEIADIACSLTLEAVCGVSTAYDKRIHNIRPHPGQKKVAEKIRTYVSGSKLVDAFPERIQDSYTLRCAPQVHGAARDAIAYVEGVITIELNSVTDNPLIFVKENEALSGGNFHGEPLAIALDVLAIAVSELANISERRTAKLVDPATSEGLPPFLISKDKGGLHSGLMITQYTAAALVSENKVWAHPASVDSIPTSANQEDHVSMGSIAARKMLRIADNAENVLSIELLSACQGINFRDTKKLGSYTKKFFNLIRQHVPFLDEDRELAPDMKAVLRLVQGDALVSLSN